MRVPLAQLEEQVRETMLRDRVPGLALALVEGGGETHVAGYGVLDAAGADAVRAESTFGAASITKPLLATAVMREVEAGRLGLDDAVEDRIAPLRFENPFPGIVSLRHLLTHTAGLPVGNAPAAPEAETLREQVEAGARAVEAPGRRIIYANWGWDILAYLLGERVGRPWHEHVYETLIAPLGMERSRIGGLPDARGHTLGADGALQRCGDPSSPVDPPTGAGSLVSSAADLGLFLALHVGGDVDAGPRLLSRDSIREMHRLQHASGRSPGGMGLGFRVDRWRGRARIAQGGDGLGTTHVAVGLPEEEVAVVLLTNLGGGEALRSELAHAALCALTGEEPRPAPLPTHPAAAPTGRYRSICGEVEIELRPADHGTAVTVASGARVATPWASKLVPLSERCFEGVGGMFDGCELVFEDDPPRFHGGLYPFTFEWVGAVSAIPPSS